MERLEQLKKETEATYYSLAAETLRGIGINSFDDYLDVLRNFVIAVAENNNDLALFHPYIKLAAESGLLTILYQIASVFVVLEQKQKIKELEEQLLDHITLNIKIQNN